METIRLRGLDPPNGETMKDPSFSNILTAWGNGCWYYEGHSTFTQNEDMVASRSESSGSMSPDLGEIWGYGCSMSPACGSQSDLDKPERPEKPEESDDHGSDSFNSSVTYGVQTAMVRRTLWPTVADAEVWPTTY